jgi:hypothetical protein
MFATIRNGATLLVLLSAATYSFGQTTVWLSDTATFTDLDITTTALPGTTGSFDIWIKTEQSFRINGVDLQLVTTGNAIAFTGADIVIGLNRFQVQRDPLVTQNDSLITDISVYSGIGGADIGTGIGPGVPVDNEALSAYRFATIYYRISGIGVSNVQLRLGSFLIGNLQPNILHLGIDDPLTDGNIIGATDITIDGRIQVVPEPNSLLLLLVARFLPHGARTSRLA